MKKSRLVLFIFSFLIPLIGYRLIVFLRGGKVSVLRELTGLKIHHSHYGVILVTVGLLLLLFYETSNKMVVISGLGLGMMLDSFISSLMPSLNRAGELFNYWDNFLGTLVLFLGVILIVMVLALRKNI